ncbi:MAG: hypothetical protein JWM35_2696, partial [Verrucomicrobia bacterium]|nr:hypothetical protein [Verrucomicrobiota bacterium]
MKHSTHRPIKMHPGLGKILPTLATVLAGLLTSSAPAATFAVHATDPSPFDGTAKGVMPGDTILLDGQTRTVFTFKNVIGSAGNPVTITNVGGAGGQFIYNNGTDPNADSWYFVGCQYIILKGTPSPGNYDYGIKIAGTVAGKYGMFFGANGSVGSSDFEIRDLE